MQKIKVNKNQLIEILKKNKEEHASIYSVAYEKYRQRIISSLKEHIQAAENSKNKKIKFRFNLTEPQNYIDEYNRAIQMLEMSVDEVVELTEQEFTNFVQDEWSWSNAWANSNSEYCQNAKLAKYQE